MLEGDRARYLLEERTGASLKILSKELIYTRQKFLVYLQARFSACTHSNSLSIWAKSAHNLERRFGGNELSRSWSKASCRIASDPILFGERVRRIDSRLALIFMLPACGLFMAGQQVGSGTKQIILSLADNVKKMNRANFQDLVMVSIFQKWTADQMKRRKTTAKIETSGAYHYAKLTDQRSVAKPEENGTTFSD